MVGDAASLDDLDRLAALVTATGRTVDVFVANAGRDVEATSIAAMTPEAFDHVAGLNFRGTFFAVQRIAPLMTDGGRIVLVSSIAGTQRWPWPLRLQRHASRPSAPSRAH